MNGKITLRHTDSPIRILVVDDEDSMRNSLALVLRRKDYVISRAHDIRSALKMLERDEINLVITDLRLENESGLDLIAKIKADYPSTESILITAYGTIESAVEAIQAGAFDYITKPFSNDQLLLKVQKAVERQMMCQELTTLRQHVAMSYGFDNIVGISKPMMQLKETARRISSTGITVLISGDSGTGKELFARAIHHHSDRRDKAFVTIDCSAIPEGLLESELFGHTKGSFTSATNDHKGLLETADGGTIFLDEVNNMTLSIQAKLLRFLQESEIRPVGSSVTMKVDVRVLAATNRNLSEAVGRGDFREDLFYRLNVIPLHIPRLIDRAEDVEILIEYFLRVIAADMGRETLSISREAVDLMLKHNWPGNIRELENTLKRGAALCHSDHLGADDIIFIVSETRSTGCTPAVPTTTEKPEKKNLLAHTQRSVISNALEENNWNFTQTAQELGIGRTTLWRKVKKFDLQRPLPTE